MCHEPNLAGTALNLVLGVLMLVGQVRQFLAQLDHVTIAILPIIEKGKVVHHFVERGHHTIHLIACRHIGENLADLNRQAKKKPCRIFTGQGVTKFSVQFRQSGGR
jgi:hypothetical protein